MATGTIEFCVEVNWYDDDEASFINTDTVYETGDGDYYSDCWEDAHYKIYEDYAVRGLKIDSVRRLKSRLIDGYVKEE